MSLLINAILKSLLTTRGDIIKRGVATVERLAKGTATHVLTMGADEPAWAAPTGAGYTEGARVYHSANQEIAHNTLTILAFNSERWDTDTIHDNVTNNSRLTCKTAGKYVISLTAAWDAQAGGRRLHYIWLNGTTNIALDQRALDPVETTSPALTTIYDLALNDYVEVRIYQNSFSAIDIVAAANYSPEFSMQRIG